MISYLDDIAMQINTILDTDVFYPNGLVSANLFPFTEQLRRASTNGEVRFPAVFEEEDKYTGIDTDLDYIIYHRVNSIVSNNATQGYGDGRLIKKLVIQCTMTVYYKHLTIKPDVIALLINGKFPTHLSVINFRSLFLLINSINLNQQTVIDKEYSNVLLPMAAEHHILQIDYTIEGSFDENCLNNPQYYY